MIYLAFATSHQMSIHYLLALENFNNTHNLQLPFKMLIEAIKKKTKYVPLVSSYV